MNMKKIIIFGGLGLVVVGGGGAGAYLYLNKKKQAAAAAAQNPQAGHEAATEEEEEEEAAGAHGEGGGPTVMTQTHIVNLQGPSKNAFLKCQLSVIVRDAELAKALTSDKPTPEREEARALVLEALSSVSSETALDMEAKESLRQDLLEKMNEKFKPKPLKPGQEEDKKHKRPKKPIKDVLIVEWAVQR